ncbi:N-acetylmuramoyl-L-alanine amidase [Streptococcus pluranimalium]|uniref:N-acetylmuramoyl-L-alanine amidase n=1 Tax=Streptococcus pluranimalium TaxID=82348 RepID=UPI003F6939E9
MNTGSKKQWVIAGITGASLFLAPDVLAEQALETVSVQTTPVVVSDNDIPATSPSEVTSQPLESAAASAPASNVVSEDSQSISAMLSENTMPSESLSSPSQSTNASTTTTHLRSTTFSTVSELSKVDASDIRVRSHVEMLGWQNPAPASQLIGTTGQGKRLEALEIRLGENMSQLGDISYQAHVQNIGWQKPVTSGGIVGTTGQSRRLEAINLQLTQELATHFDLYYRAHVQDYGWLSWAKNGANVGTEGLSKRLEALEIQILPKGTIFTGDTHQAFIKRVEMSASIYYRSYIEKQGWQTEVIGGSISGSTGKNQQIEALGIRLQSDYLGSVSYETHIQNIGWIKGVRDGDISGQGGSNRQIEALKISLVGDISHYYDVYYRVHSQNKGWLGWTKNGLASGTEGFGLGIEGFEVTLVKKGAKAPKTTTAFVKKENSNNPALSASQGNYNKVNKIVYLDAGHGGYDPGASYGGVSEKILNLQMQNLIKRKLEQAGFQVLTSRTTDCFMDLLPRSNKANQSLADLFISIHFNASTSAVPNGIETYYYQYYPEYQPSLNKTYHNDPERLKRSEALAKAIQGQLIKETGAKNNGVFRDTFAVLRETTAPAVLLELGYLSNVAERSRVVQAAYQEKLANGVVSGILNYYKTFSV